MGLKRKIKILLVKLIYDKKYLVGKNFENESSRGWGFAFKCIYHQKILRINGNIPWPVNPQTKINNYENIIFDLDDLNNFQSPGCYFQNFSGKIYIGKGTYIAPNTGFITANHNVRDLDRHCEGKDIVLGENCWIGMNSVILPGVTLGNRTIVGAGAIVTKSFEEGNIVIAGNPAKIIKRL